MKKLVLTTMLVGLAAGVCAADRAGLAVAKEPFSITRSNVSAMQRANVLTEVMVGDHISSGSSPVRLTCRSGQAVMIAPDSAITMTTDKDYLLDKGSVIVSVPANQTSSVKYSDITFQPEAPQKLNARGQSIFIVSQSAEDELLVQGIEHRVSVVEQSKGNQLASVGAGDVLKFEHNEDSWMASVPSPGAPAAEGGGSAVEGDSQTGATGEEDDDNKAYYQWGAVGLGIIGGYVYYTETQDDDKNLNKDNKSKVGNEPTLGQVPPILLGLR